MIYAYHSVFSMYGFWLPNDPRGSGSDYIGNWELFRYGGATKLASRERSVAGKPHSRHWQQTAKDSLRYPAVHVTGEQAVAIVEGFSQACCAAGYVIHACAILPDHVHLVIAEHRRPIRQIVGHLKSAATRRLKDAGLWPHSDWPVWGAHGWNVFLDDLNGVRRAITYVEANPLKEGKRRQRWGLVTPFGPSASQATRRNGRK